MLTMIYASFDWLIETPHSEHSIRHHGKNTFLVARRTTTMYAPTPYRVDIDSRHTQTTTRESKWDMPEELLQLMEMVENEKQETPAPPASYVV